MHKSCEQHLPQTSTIPFTACFLQYNGFLLPAALKLGFVIQVIYAHNAPLQSSAELCTPVDRRFNAT